MMNPRIKARNIHLIDRNLFGSKSFYFETSPVLLRAVIFLRKFSLDSSSSSMILSVVITFRIEEICSLDSITSSRSSVYD